jgi:hypothetical protein
MHTTNFRLGAAYPTHITRISSLANFSNRDIQYFNKMLSIITVFI